MPGDTGTGDPEFRWSDEPFVGRQDLVDELVAVTRGAIRGIGSLVLITGEAGIGKTSVTRALMGRVRSGICISHGVCVADRSAPPFWPWRDLIDVAGASTESATDDSAGAPRLELLSLLRDTITTSASGQPRLHVIEDLQWADVASVLLLAEVGSTIAGSPLAVVATIRSGEARSPQLDDCIEEVRRMARIRQLPPLTAPEIATVAGAMGTEPTPPLISLIESRTGGNPLFVTELLRSVSSAATSEQRVAALGAGVPDRVAGLVRRRLRALPEPVSDVLVTASVLGAEGDTAVLAATHGRPIEAVLGLLDQARAARVLDAAGAGRWRFRHQLVRDAVYDGAPVAERARRHAAAVDCLSAAPSTQPVSLATHALGAGPLIESARAVDLYARAGDSTFAQHAYEEAIAWYTHALDVSPEDTTTSGRADLLMSCGDAHRHLGDTAAARDAFVAAASISDDPALLARAALGFADPGADLGIAYRANDTATAQLLERALAAQPDGPSLVTVQLQARLAAELYFSDEPERARALAAAAVDAATTLGDPRALGVAAAVDHDAFQVGQAPIADQLAGSDQLVGWARDCGSTAALLGAHRARALDLLAGGDLVAADAEMLAFRRRSSPLRVPGYQWWPALWDAMHALLEGRHDIAEGRATAALRLGERCFPSLAFLNFSFLLFFLRREQGRLAEMEQVVRDFAADQPDVPALRVGLTLLLAETGARNEAQDNLRTFDDGELWRLTDRNWPASWFQLARATFLLRDRDLASRLATRSPDESCIQVSLATVCLGASALGRAWLAHTLGDLDDADQHYRAAEELDTRIGARSWLAQTRADRATLLWERDRPGDRTAADHLRSQADDAAASIGLATLGRGPASDAAEVGTRARFRRHGSGWEVDYAGRTAHIPDSRGMRDVAHLLARPGQSISVLEFVGDAARGPVVRGAEALDERARREIHRQLVDLDQAEADAENVGDGERAALIREERQILAESVVRDFGLAGRSRRIDDPVERARKTVSTRLRRTIAGIGREHPELERHLDRSIDTGTWCAYRPAETVVWET